MKQRDWYFVRSGEKVGPITTQQLIALARAKKLSGDDLVWCDGLSDWTPASKIKGLLPSEPPPLPPVQEPSNQEPPFAATTVPNKAAALDDGNSAGQPVVSESFVEWHNRRLSLIHSLPSVICWGAIFLIWTYGCGFAWIPIWYLIDTADGGDLGSKLKSLVNRIPVGQCPACKQNWAREVVDKQLLGKRQGYRTVTRYDEHRVTKPGSFIGEKVGETRRDEQVVVTICTYLLTCHCKKCGHTWNERADEER